ncbi:MAG: pgl [Hydrocarboniphaga sp.]|uniref:6-phosphogluconolactonase n=1 Tax=Hydrocarboniphaga sp. TaxID=2033016 RepID=UPI00261530EC|nr:6-phosphogluconolactonase [Hydrocarboniphaga sp.]MDB5971535.1 pgl [Hydrocarboniphaga sp.]
MSSALKLPENVQQQLYPDAGAAAQALADAVAGLLREALSARPLASLMLSGGKSPIPFFQKLSLQDLDWSRVCVGLVDDRWVDANDPDSNERLLREHLLKNAAASAQLVPLKNAQREPEQGVDEAEKLVAAIPRPFDALVLGVGDDGHTASLFPCATETPAAMVSRRLVAATRPQTAPHPRITLTFPTILDSRAIFVAIGGESKRAVIERAVVLNPPLPIGDVLLQSTAPVHVYWSP